ncbi:MAG: monovalent cation/H(+) antiporter subunit G, partial [Sphingomonadales bacterium]|nr:monovalent cation/H(+) antiporter subunit G [Sphingomonadales bacterium]
GGRFGVPELLITLFLFITAPVSANLMAKAALHLKVPSKAGRPAGIDDGAQTQDKQG